MPVFVEQPINLFIKSADELFGPISSIRRSRKPVKHIPWTSFTISTADWERVNDVRTIISDANGIQHLFSSDGHPSLWLAIPAFEELLSAWEEKLSIGKYAVYRSAIERGIDKLKKYYYKFDSKDVYILALGKIFNLVIPYTN